MNRLPIFCFVFFFLFVSVAPINATPSESNKDSLETISLLRLSEQNKNASKALAYAMESLLLAKKLNSHYLMAKVYCRLTYLYRQERAAMVFVYDSLYLTYAVKSNNSLFHFDALQLTIKDYLNINDLHNAERYLLQMDTLMVDNTDETRLCVNEQLRAFYYTKKFKPRDGLVHAKKSLKYAENIKNRLLKGRSLHHIAECFSYSFKNDSAAIYYFSALDEFKAIADGYEMAGCYYGLAFINQVSANMPKAIEYYNTAQRTYQQSGFPIDAAHINFQLAEIYFSRQKTDSAGVVIKNAVREFEKYKFEQGKSIAYSYLSRYYRLTNQKDSANYYMDISAKGLSKQNNPLFDFFRDSHDAIMKIQEGDILGGETMSKKLVAKMRDIFPAEVLQASAAKVALITDSSSQIRDYTSSLLKGDTTDLILDNTLVNPFTGTNVLLDSIVSMKVQNQVAQIESKYRVKEARDSTLLAQQQGRLLQEKLTKRNLILIFSLILLAAAIALTYTQVKGRQRANAEKKRALEDQVIIRNLKEELDHRVDNTLNNIGAIIRRVKEKSTDNSSFELLEQKIDPLIQLYKILKENKSSTIELQDYFEQLCAGLKSFYDHQDNVKIMIDAPVEMPGSKAGRIGLILNELVTNSFKHAFTEDGHGTITIRCYQTDDQQYLLSVSDSGNCIPLANTNGSRKGLKLVKLLAHELEAKIVEKRNEGIEFEFYFF